VFLIICLFSTVVLSSPAANPNHLFISGVNYSSDILRFTEYETETIYSESRSSTDAYNATHLVLMEDFMVIDDRYENSTIEVEIGDGPQKFKIYESKLWSLKYNRWNNTYMFPSFSMEKIYNISNNMSYFDGKIIILKLDGTVLREYLLGYSGLKKYNLQAPENYPFNLGMALFVIFSLLIAPIMLVVILILHILKRKKVRKK
jgi:hypothetical protein